MEDERIEVCYERNFDTLLFDSILTLMQSREIPEYGEIHQTLARSSVLSSLLLLEMSANTCIESLNLGRAVFGEIDRLPIAAKFDFYLRTNFRNKSLERGNTNFETLRELKALRDSFVHLKPYQVEWRYQGDNGSAEVERTKCLQVAKNPRSLNADDAIKIMTGVHDFLGYFFRVKCKYSADRVAAILFSEDKIPTKDGARLIPVLSRSTKTELRSLGVDLNYIRIM
jgi:hypothetical protein